MCQPRGAARVDTDFHHAAARLDPAADRCRIARRLLRVFSSAECLAFAHLRFGAAALGWDDGPGKASGRLRIEGVPPAAYIRHRNAGVATGASQSSKVS